MKGMPSSLSAPELRPRGVMAVALLACGLLVGGRAFVAAPLATQVPNAVPEQAIGARLGAGRPSPFARHASSQLSWQHVCCAAAVLACAAHKLSSPIPKGKAAKGGRTATVVCRAAQAPAWQHIPLIDTCRSVEPTPAARHPLCSDVAATAAIAAAPLIDLHAAVYTQVPQAASPHVATAAAIHPAAHVAGRAATTARRTGRAARRAGGARHSGARRSKGAAFAGSSAAAAARGSERAERQRIGSRLQQGEAVWSEVPPATFDISRVRSHIQMGLQVTSRVSAQHGRERNCPKSAVPGASKSSSVRIQSMSFLVAREGGKHVLGY